jgi:hypothetical protein
MQSLKKTVNKKLSQKSNKILIKKWYWVEWNVVCVKALCRVGQSLMNGWYGVCVECI